MAAVIRTLEEAAKVDPMAADYLAQVTLASEGDAERALEAEKQHNKYARATEMLGALSGLYARRAAEGLDEIIVSTGHKTLEGRFNAIMTQAMIEYAGSLNGNKIEPKGLDILPVPEMELAAE